MFVKKTFCDDMKRKFCFIICSLVVCQLFIACNNLSSSNPNLPGEILQSLLADKVSKESASIQRMTEGFTPKPGAKYLQERDMSAQPIRIDILKGIDNVHEITLNQIAEDVIYVNIGEHRFGPSVQLTPHGILASSFDGVWLYAADGQLIREIYKNICEYQPVGIQGVMLKTGDKFKGVQFVQYNEKDDRLWVKYVDDDLHKGNYQGFLGYIDMNKRLDVSFNEIQPDPIIPVATLEKGGIGYTEDFAIQRPLDIWKNILITSTFRGDTLCCFEIGFDSIRNEIFRRARNADSQSQYYFHGLYTFKPPQNDTLFRLTAANTLKPEYILPTSRGPLSGDESYDQIYIVQSVREDERYLYITFTVRKFQESNKRRQWYGLYNKNTGEFFTLPVLSDSRFYENGITNNLDGGLPFWPQSFGVNGEKWMYMQGKEMKTLLTDKWFAQSKALKPEKKASLMQFLQTVKENDYIVIMIK